MQKLKQEYNTILKRYCNGCDYLFNNPNEWDKYESIVLKLLDRLNAILNIIPATEEEILNGFKA